MSVAVCSLCGEEWPRDPRLEVPCPNCKARIGQRCKRPSGHDCDWHIDREEAAIQAGFLSRTCPARERQRDTLQAPFNLFGEEL